MSVRIGITGGIGSGKSVVSRLLGIMGVPVYISDDEAKLLTAGNADIRRALSALAGSDLYDGGAEGSGTMRKEVLASYLFASADNAARVNAVVHPAVKAGFVAWADSKSSLPIVGIESAILIEAGFTDVVDKVVMVYAPLETRVARAMARDGVEQDKVLQRIKAQMDDEQKRSQADFVIVNDGRVPLIPQLLELIDKLTRR